ncbi:MAG: EscU/YscU/HrcU family type III secretion system export apparatus switch protein [Anaeromyxobacter sp.]|nr:EscU/YscU/HrcU family type III secretion system export apparatus switch protein [Anaeromyxobacter sp.]MBL0275816.1 EscU/YscU/HrcU family type III secretion system export apparatus switch protein [Anaeromyxobacter sp.]
MSGPRTEAPTPRRLAEARRRGEVAVSRELTGAVALAAGLAALAAAGPALLDAAARLLRRGLGAALGQQPPPAAALLEAAGAVARLSALPCLAALVAGAAAGLLQSGGLLAPAAVAPRAGRLDPASGLARLVSGDRLAAVGLGLLKATLVAGLALLWARGALPALAALPRAAHPLSALGGVLAPLLRGLLVALLLLGGADLLLARRRHQRRLRMTRDEVRREQREDEGDPAHRGERRRRHRALLEATPVARATCLVVNPTHVAVALLHRRERDEPPRVVAKGRGAAARRLRSEARRAGVPIVRDVALARALHRLAEVGDELPEPLYDAAAAVLAHLYGAPAGGAA